LPQGGGGSWGKKGGTGHHVLSISRLWKMGVGNETLSGENQGTCIGVGKSGVSMSFKENRIKREKSKRGAGR